MIIVCIRVSRLMSWFHLIGCQPQLFSTRKGIYFVPVYMAYWHEVYTELVHGERRTEVFSANWKSKGRL